MGALTLALLLMAVQAPALAVLALTVVTGSAGGYIYVRYRGDLQAAEIKEVPGNRARLDLIVAGDLRAAIAVGLAASVVALALGDHRPDLGVAPISAVILGVTAAVILLSSLIDWYVILPRVGGLLGIRPCRRPHGRFSRRPKTWREVTRWWYIHRIVAAVVLRFGLSFAVSFTVARHISIPYGGSIVAGAVVGAFAGYIAAVPKAVIEAGHVTLIVGDTVVRRDVQRVPRTVSVFGRKVRVPLMTMPVAGDFREREYVYDVALEGAQLVPAADREGELPHDEDGELIYQDKANKLQVKDVGACNAESVEAFTGCSARCSGINWYCMENPLCFEPK
jgi:hypothetical protein